MSSTYLYIALALLQLIIAFSTIRSTLKARAMLGVQLGLIGALLIDGFSNTLKSNESDLYIHIICFLIIFIVPRFR